MLTKQIFQGIKFNSISQPLCMVILFVRNVFLVRLLGIEDYGFYVIVVTSFIFLEPIFTLQTDRSLLRYLPEYNSETKLGKFKALVIYSLKWSLSSLSPYSLPLRLPNKLKSKCDLVSLFSPSSSTSSLCAK